MKRKIFFYEADLIQNITSLVRFSFINWCNYIIFPIYLGLCITLPLTMKYDGCGGGLKWNAWYIFCFALAIFSLVEFLGYWLFFKDQVRDSLFKYYKDKPYIVHIYRILLQISGFVSRMDLITDITFILDARLCKAEYERIEDETKTTDYNPIKFDFIITMSFIVIILSICYQVFYFGRLLVKGACNSSI